MDTKVLLFAIVSFAALASYRVYDYLVTGWFLPDEYAYFYDAMRGATYQYRLFFGWVNIDIFRLFGIDSADKFAVFLWFYILFWASLTLVIFYKTLKLLRFGARTIALTILCSLFLVSFTLLSLGFLTEPMGVSLSMLGVYFLLRWIKSGIGLWKQALYPLAAALSFAAAMYTREPYAILLIGGLAIVPLASMTMAKRSSQGTWTRRALLVALPAIFFIIPGLLFLLQPVDFTAVVIRPALSAVIQVVSHNLGPGPTSSTVTSSVTSSITSSVTSTVTSSVTSSVTSTTSTSATTPPPGPASTPQLFAAMWIFILGVTLGWGPVPLLLFVIGFIFLLVRSQQSGLFRLILVLILGALGSFAVVSFVMAQDPYYMTFGGLSTIIRYSDTSIVACFLAMPFAISLAIKKRGFIALIIISLVAFSASAIPIYSSFTTSNFVLTQNLGGNPFLPSFRTPSASIRDYVVGHASEAPFFIVGVPTYYGFSDVWNFTPGTRNLPVDFFQNMSQSSFLEYRWTSFYIYGEQDLNGSSFNVTPFFMELLNGTAGGDQLPFHVIDRQVIFNQTAFLVRLQVVWGEA